MIRLFQKRFILGIAALICAGAVALQSGLIKRFSVIKVESTGKFTPAIARLGQESLVILKDPALSVAPNDYSAEDLLLSHEGIENGVVDVHFDRAQLSQETAALLTGAGINPRFAYAEIDYSVDMGREHTTGEPCRTSVKVLWKTLPRRETEVYFFQMGTSGSHLNRHIEMRASDAELLVEMITEPAPQGDPRAPG